MNIDTSCVLGLGIDLIEIDRVEKAYERYDKVFLEKVFTLREIEYCLGFKNPCAHLAVRFAAKEAVAKAFSKGIGGYLSWKSVSIGKGENNEPIVVLDEKARELLRSIGGKQVNISLTHTKTMAQAIAIIQ